MKNIINHSYNHILEDINTTCQKNNRDPKSVKVIAICKRQPFKKLLQAIDTGINYFGENRVQDGINRWSKIKSKKITRVRIKTPKNKIILILFLQNYLSPNHHLIFFLFPFRCHCNQVNHP